MFKTILPVVFGLFQVLKANKPTAKFCVRAKDSCIDDPFQCGLAYLRFIEVCDLIGIDKKQKSTRSHQNWTQFQPPKPKRCSKDCVKAIGDLKSTKLGRELHGCDCRLDGDCLIVKARVAKCLNKTQNPSISCTASLWNCTRDPTCRFLQSKFLDDCREMFNGVRCDKRCLKIQDRLFRSTYGKPLRYCECDGPGEAYCRAVKGHAKQLRCLPGMDGSGTPVFTYVQLATDPGIIHGNIQEDEPKGAANFQTLSIWAPMVLVLTLFLL